MPEDSFKILADHKVLSKAKSRLDLFYSRCAQLFETWPAAL